MPARIPVILMIIFLFPAAAFGQEARKADPPSGAALEAIASRMKALSASLAQMPEPPRLDQTLQIPVLPVSSSSHKSKPLKR